MYIEVKQGVVRWYYHVKSANGNILSTSQKYYSRSNALRAARKLSKHIKADVRVR